MELIWSVQRHWNAFSEWWTFTPTFGLFSYLLAFVFGIDVKLVCWLNRAVENLFLYMLVFCHKRTSIKAVASCPSGVDWWIRWIFFFNFGSGFALPSFIALMSMLNDKLLVLFYLRRYYCWCVCVFNVQARAVHDGLRQIPTSNELVNFTKRIFARFFD